MEEGQQLLTLELPPEVMGLRLDQALTQIFSDHTRAQIQTWLRDNRVTVDEKPGKASQRVLGMEQVRVLVPEPESGDWAAEDIPLDICFEDEDILVINKPAGLVTHPAPGNREGTLLNAIVHHAPACATLARAGIVHRLDKDTSGLLVVAKSEAARQDLIDQLAAREVTREYRALVVGALTGGGRIEAPIGRHPLDRKRMGVVGSGKPAVTHYRIAERFPRHTLLKVRLETGRTHQIRVHMAYMHHPIVGDPVYGGRQMVPPGLNEAQQEQWRSFRRQALHAAHLAFMHPRTGEYLSWSAPLPKDFEQILQLLREVKAASEDKA